MVFNHRPKALSPCGTLGSSSNLQFKTERIKIPLTPRYPRSVVGSDRGENFLALPSLPAASPCPLVQCLGIVYTVLVISATHQTLVEPSPKSRDVRSRRAIQSLASEFKAMCGDCVSPGLG